MPYPRTSDLARAVGIQPTTVRCYVERGILPSVARGDVSRGGDIG